MFGVFIFSNLKFQTESLNQKWDERLVLDLEIFSLIKNLFYENL